jgi:hypothetical protein
MTTTSTTTEEEIEINFRLDANGRTLPQEGATLLVGEVVGSASSIGNHQQADYDCKTFETAFSGPSSSEEEQAVLLGRCSPRRGNSRQRLDASHVLGACCRQEFPTSMYIGTIRF